MKVIAIHNLENVAQLLAEIALITEVGVFSVSNIGKLKEYLEKYKFEAIYILDNSFEKVIELLFSKKEYPKNILILVQNEKNIEKFLRLGISEQNLETIPFNPLSLFVKTKALISTIKSLEKSLKEGASNFDFYRVGLFNLLNYLASTNKNWTVSVKNRENNQILYSLKLVNGQVESSNLDISKIAAINLDDTIPKVISLEELPFKKVEFFEGTDDFYKRLLKISLGKLTVEGSNLTIPPKVELITSIRENLFRERRIYSFQYKGFEIFTQPAMEMRKKIHKNTVIVCAELTDNTVLNLKTLLIRNPDLKLLVPPIIKERLKISGLKERNFIDLPGVETFNFPFLGSKFEGALYFPNGILITGNLFGSFVSKNISFLEKVFLSHFRIFHYSNISSNERFKSSLRELEDIIDRAQYIIPTYGYAIDYQFINECWQVLNQLEIPATYSPLSSKWKQIADTYKIAANNYEDFVKVLKEKDGAFLFNILDDMEVLGIVPFEF